MKVIEFKGCNVVYAEDQPEYLKLPGLRMEDGELMTCWELSIKERLKILFTGKMWLNILTSHKPLQPLKMSVDKPFYAIQKGGE